MYPVTIDNLKRLAVQRGAVGFDYSANGNGDIDGYRFRFAFEDIEPIVSVNVSPVVAEPTPIPIPIPDIDGPDMADFATDEVMCAVDIPSVASIPEPEILPFASIPDSMRKLRRWCVWQKHPDGRKMPYRVLPGGFWSRKHRCKSDTPSEWVSFDEALHCYLKSNGHLGGLSFALGDGWWGADFDDVIVDGKVHPQAESWLARLGGYRETSQSKKGEKAILRGTLNDNFLGSATTGRQFKDIPAPGMAVEVYDKRRFFFLTGNGSGEPRENQSALDALCAELLALKEANQPKPKMKPKPVRSHSSSDRPVTLSDDAVIDKIRRSRQASKFDTLFSGHIGTYPSASEADMALTRILMYWCQNDRVQVERLFERSGLAKREKWDREDYRERTLAKAEQSKVYTPLFSDRQRRLMEKLGVVK